MEHFALIVIQWLGRAIAQKIAGSAIQAVWQRFAPYYEQLFKAAETARQTASEYSEVTEKIAQQTSEITALLNTADAQLALLLARNEQLQAENQDLRARLAQYEPA